MAYDYGVLARHGVLPQQWVELGPASLRIRQCYDGHFGAFVEFESITYGGLLLTILCTTMRTEHSRQRL